MHFDSSFSTKSPMHFIYSSQLKLSSFELLIHDNRMHTCTCTCVNKNIITQPNHSMHSTCYIAKWQNLCAVSESWLHAIFYTAHGHPVKILNHACISSISIPPPQRMQTRIVKSIYFSAFKSIKHAICTTFISQFSCNNFKIVVKLDKL